MSFGRNPEMRGFDMVIHRLDDEELKQKMARRLHKNIVHVEDENGDLPSND